MSHHHVLDTRPPLRSAPSKFLAANAPGMQSIGLKAGNQTVVHASRPPSLAARPTASLDGD
jgi:hypothetical protein